MKLPQLITLALLLASTAAYAQPRAAMVRVEKAQLEAAQPTYEIIGTLRAASRAEVAGRESGAVERVFFNEGDSIEEGAILAELDARRLELMLAEAESELAAQEALIAQAELEQKRAKADLDAKQGLNQRGVISQSDFLDSEQTYNLTATNLTRVQQTLNATKNRIELLNIRIADTAIRAPFDGIAIQRHVEPGEWLREGDAVAVLLASDPLEAWFTVPERFFTQARENAESLQVTITASDLEVKSDSVRVIPDINPRTRTFEVIATVANPEGRLSAGMSVVGSTPVGPEVAYLHFSKDGLVNRGGQTFAFTVSAGERGQVANMIPIDVAFYRENDVYVAEGVLPDGALIIIEGNERLQPGQAVAIPEPPANDDDSLAAAADADKSGKTAQ